MFYDMKQEQNILNSVEKALNILLAFQEERPVWGVREMAAYLAFSPATVQRILSNLKAYDFVDQDPDTRQYRLGNIYFRFLHTLQSTYPFTRTALIFMQRLMSITRETVHLNVIENKERICVDNIESPQHLKATMPVGSRSPLYAGASSKCLLAFSPQEFIDRYLKTVKLRPVTEHTITDIQKLRTELAAIKKQGYAASLGERNPGLGSLSAPVLNHRGMLLASLSLAVPEIRYKDNDYRQIYIKELVHAAQNFSKKMGYQDSP